MGWKAFFVLVALSVFFVSSTHAQDISPYSANYRREALCTDSDGGVNDSVKGVVVSRYNEVLADYCLTPSTLVERYCDFRFVRSHRHRFVYCVRGCHLGACRGEETHYLLNATPSNVYEPQNQSLDSTPSSLRLLPTSQARWAELFER